MKKVYNVETEEELDKLIYSSREQGDDFPFASGHSVCLNFKTDQVWLEDGDGNPSDVYLTKGLSAREFIKICHPSFYIRE